MARPDTPKTSRPADRGTLAGAIAALAWGLFCLAWFDVAAPWRPAALARVSPLALLAVTLAAGGFWVHSRRATFWGAPLGSQRASILMLLGLTLFFRLPIVIGGAASAVTSDGALSGIVALHARDGQAHDVFVPHVPYSGSLKSHLTAPLAILMDPARAFALASVLFYLAYVAGLFRLALVTVGRRAAVLAGLYAAFSPPFVTRYSLSNDGNYVEVLAFGTWAVLFAVRWIGDHPARSRLALAAGLLLGLAFWCHILAVIPLAAVAGLMVLAGRAASLRSLAALAWGWAIGYAPGWLWNLGNGWLSFHYLLPGEARAGEAGRQGVEAVFSGLGEKMLALLSDHGPVLMGYDSYRFVPVDRLLLAAGWIGVLAAAYGVARGAARSWRERSWPQAALVLFVLTNFAVALLALPHVPGNPRYVLFVMGTLPVLLADAFGHGRRLFVLLLLISVGALASFAQVPPTLVADARLRAFVSDMETAGVRHCYTDFFMATRVNFLSQEKIVCSAKLGPITTEYFFEYRERVERAPEAAFIAVNQTSARRLERRLAELGVGYERLDSMKPVLHRLTRKVDPEELFPGREFPIR